MKTKKLTLSEKLCAFSVVIVLLAQTAEKILEVSIVPSQNMALVCAIMYTLCVLTVFWFIFRSTDTIWSMFAALLAMKMLPPNIGYFAQVSADGYMLYYVVQRMAVLLFAALVYKTYCAQAKPRAIKALPVLLLVLAVPFTSRTAQTVDSYLLYRTGSMIAPYLSQYAFYALAAIAILIAAYLSGFASMKFAAYFEFAAFGINAVRNLGKICVLAATHQHVSKSFYGWIVLYAVLAACFAVALAKSKKAVPAPAAAEE